MIGSEEQEQQQSDEKNGEDQADDLSVAAEEKSQLIDDEGDDVSENALISDGESGPFCGVHLPSDGADGGEAGRAEQVENEERITGQRRHALEIENAENGDDFFLGHKAHDGGDGGFL